MAEILYRAKVTAKSGSTVRLRFLPATSAKVIEIIPVDETVEVLEETNDEWCFVSDSGVTGYMMKKFLTRIEDNEPIEDNVIQVSAERLSELRECLSAALTMVEEIMDVFNVG